MTDEAVITKPRFTTRVQTRSITNCITGQKTTFPNRYTVFDREKQTECVFIGNKKFTSYEEVEAKAEELNKKLEATADKANFFYF